MNDPAPAPFAYRGPQEWLQPIADALRRVVDPEVAMTIVDVGLVYSVEVSAQQWHLVMTMTSAACPVTDLILEEAQAELDRIAPDGTRVEIELVWEPPWTTERMSARAKAFMGW